MSSDIKDRCLQSWWTPQFGFWGVLLFLVAVPVVEGEFLMSSPPVVMMRISVSWMSIRMGVPT
jgi:hypothetical protein